jgi:hypothetical protein
MRCKQEFISPGPHVSPQETSGSHMKQKMTQFVKEIEFFLVFYEFSYPITIHPSDGHLVRLV